ncbi:MAG: transcriptional regulator [Sphingomonas sp.]|uniref:winged helix-turn-helix transcriptional regulator n=1 Tax=Sphingomonas sp. TaxID=28214 RepID=UPI001AD07BB3|nr:winged helix-turn-helix transcriptional regulator [Sphingomonas sp.]MBN8808116.1 transcriptional regulator [Sphingomonas sp.]
MKLQKVTEVEKAPTRRWYDDACGTALALEFVGERWALLIIRELLYGPRRFGEIRANLPGISANVLTQRLDSLEGAGIVVRRRLPSPANIQVYDLTDWGREAEVPIREMGRWAARSPLHNPLAFMSTASAMTSLRTLIDPAKAAGKTMTVALRFPDDAFVARVADGELIIVRGEAADADATLTGDTLAMRHTIYGKRGFDGDGLLAVAGDRAAAQAFVDLFALPEKIAS